MSKKIFGFLLFLAAHTIYGNNIVIPCITASVYNFGLHCDEIGHEKISQHSMAVLSGTTIDTAETCKKIMHEKNLVNISFSAYYFLDENEVFFVNCEEEIPVAKKLKEIKKRIGTLSGSDTQAALKAQEFLAKKRDKELEKRSKKISQYILKNK